MAIQIFADTSCDMPPELARVLGVERVSFHLTIDKQEFVDDEALQISTLLAAMRAYNGPASTACPSPEAFAEKMRGADACFVVTISSKLSGCYNSAVTARDMVLEEFPDKKIHVFDSESAAAGETRIAMLLHKYIVEELPFEEIVDKTTRFIRTMHTRFVLDDLKNLVKNGRLSKVAGLVGTMLNIRPILADDGHGEIVALEKVRGTQQALSRLAQIVEQETRGLEQGLTLVITHCNCHERAQALKKDLLARCPWLGEVWVIATGGLSSVYANDGGIVLAF